MQLRQMPSRQIRQALAAGISVWRTHRFWARQDRLLATGPLRFARCRRGARLPARDHTQQSSVYIRGGEHHRIEASPEKSDACETSTEETGGSLKIWAAPITTYASRQDRVPAIVSLRRCLQFAILHQDMILDELAQTRDQLVLLRRDHFGRAPDTDHGRYGEDFLWKG